MQKAFTYTQIQNNLEMITFEQSYVEMACFSVPPDSSEFCGEKFY